MPRNPSELSRLEADLEWCKSSLFEGIHSKTTKEYLLREIHKLERQLGISELTKYNGIG